MEQRFERLGNTFVQGDYVHTRDPNLAHRALVSEAASFRRVESPLRPLLGTSLGLVDGDRWKSRRQLLLPAFRQALAAHASVVTAATERALDEWSTLPEHDLYGTLRLLMLRIMAESLLGWTPGEDVLRSLVLQLKAVTELGSMLRAADEDIGRWTAVQEALVSLVDLKEARAPVLAVLSAAREQGELDEEELRQEVYGLLLAGQDTVVLTLALALWFFEPDAPLGLRSPEARSCYLREVLRLYPPAYAIPRCAVEAVDVVAQGQQLVVWTYFVHRSEQSFDEPLLFRPERWQGERRPSVGSYLPFGAGGHRCIGEKLAMETLNTCLVTFGDRIGRMRRQGTLPVLLPFVTLTPSEPMLVDWRG